MFGTDIHRMFIKKQYFKKYPCFSLCQLQAYQDLDTGVLIMP